ncbi:MAG: universal stress protein [Planctomycetota bacterium]
MSDTPSPTPPANDSLDSRVLVAVSSPWASEKLITPVADLAKRLDSEVVIAHVATLQDQDDHESEATERGEQTLRTMVKGLGETGVSAEGVMLFSDDTPKAILNTARARRCTMIALGLTGKGALKRLISGDVPANLIRQTDLPVLLLPANWDGTL